MSNGDVRHLRIAGLGSRLLAWLRGYGPDRADSRHLHWDRQARRWVTHEAARLSTPAPSTVAAYREPRNR